MHHFQFLGHAVAVCLCLDNLLASHQEILYRQETSELQASAAAGLMKNDHCLSLIIMPQ